MKPTTVSVLCLLMFLTVIATDSYAIPAFARKYDMSCNTCHRPAPRLKHYGEEFAGNGFVLADKEAPRAYRDTGDDELMLLREVPFALRLEGYGSWRSGDAGKADMQWPYLLKLLSGGQIANHVSYYFYFFFGERGEVAGLEDAFVMFNNVFNADFDIYLGQFQASDPLFKRELRMTLEDYQIYRVKPGLSSANLTYDRGIMMTYGFPTGTDITVEVLNGAGIGAADASRSFDTDKYKNTMFRISQDLGEHFRIGGFAYFGREEGENPDLGPSWRGVTTNDMWMAGPDVTVELGNVQLNAQYVSRSDENPFLYTQNWIAGTGPAKVKTNGAFGELIITPGGDDGKWYCAALYNWVDSEQNSLDYETITGHVGYMLARNFRVVGELTHDAVAKSTKVSVGFVSAF
jgi:hypothetical protein